MSFWINLCFKLNLINKQRFNQLFYIIYYYLLNIALRKAIGKDDNMTVPILQNTADAVKLFNQTFQYLCALLHKNIILLIRPFLLDSIVESMHLLIKDGK